MPEPHPAPPVGSDAPGSDPRPDTRLERVLVVVGVVVLAFNLRPAAVSVGPLLEEVTGGLGMGAVAAGVLTTLPVVSFAVFGFLAPGAARGLGMHRVILVALLAAAGGMLARATTSSAPVFLVLTVVALAGMATANVLLPSLVKLHFPHRVGLLTSLYSTALAVGLTAASVLSVPVAEEMGTWRWGLAVWGLVALAATLPWLLLVRHDSVPRETPRTIALRDVARTRLGWAMALLFGLQSAQAYTVFGWFAQVYRDAGFSAVEAGLLLGVVTGVSIPVSLLVPTLAARMRDQRWLMLALVACYPAGYLGLALLPVQGAWVWACLVGLGTGVFPLTLTLIGLRARTPAGTSALSGFTQGVGYALAALGPFGISLVRAATGGWTWPLVVLTAAAVLTAWLGVLAARSRFVEDELAPGAGQVSLSSPADRRPPGPRSPRR